MIGHLHGTVLEANAGSVILSVAGVGYLVRCQDQLSIRAAHGDEVSVYTHLVVRETALDLYGFENKLDLEFFEMLITISGIGPKVGLSILNAATPETLHGAISRDDTSVLTKVSGIGKKNAQKIVLELKNKMDKFSGMFGAEGESTDIAVFEALEALGYDSRSIQQVLKEHSFADMETPQKIKAAIQLLGK